MKKTKTIDTRKELLIALTDAGICAPPQGKGIIMRGSAPKKKEDPYLMGFDNQT